MASAGDFGAMTSTSATANFGNVMLEFIAYGGLKSNVGSVPIVWNAKVHDQMKAFWTSQKGFFKFIFAADENGKVGDKSLVSLKDGAFHKETVITNLQICIDIARELDGVKEAQWLTMSVEPKKNGHGVRPIQTRLEDVSPTFAQHAHFDLKTHSYKPNKFKSPYSVPLLAQKKMPRQQPHQ